MFCLFCSFKSFVMFACGYNFQCSHWKQISICFRDVYQMYRCTSISMWRHKVGWTPMCICTKVIYKIVSICQAILKCIDLAWFSRLAGPLKKLNICLPFISWAKDVWTDPCWYISFLFSYIHGIIIDYDIISYYTYFWKKSPLWVSKKTPFIYPTDSLRWSFSTGVLCLRMIRKSHAENRLESSDMGWSWLRVGDFDRKMGRDGKVKVTTID